MNRRHGWAKVAHWVDRACCVAIGSAYLWACAQYLLQH